MSLRRPSNRNLRTTQLELSIPTYVVSARHTKSPRPYWCGGRTHLLSRSHDAQANKVFVVSRERSTSNFLHQRHVRMASLVASFVQKGLKYIHVVSWPSFSPNFVPIIKSRHLDRPRLFHRLFLLLVRCVRPPSVLKFLPQLFLVFLGAFGATIYSFCLARYRRLGHN